MARFLRQEPAIDAVLGAGYDPLTNRDVRRRVAVQVRATAGGIALVE